MTILVKKLKPSAVMTLGCGGLLFIGSLGALMSVAGSRVPSVASNPRHDLVELEVKPGQTSEWVNRPKDVEAFAWGYPNAIGNYLDAEKEFVDGSRKVDPIGAIDEKPVSRVRFTNRGKGISATIKVWYRKTTWNG